ncbi:MAG: glycosyltransferase [Oligoflexales bacterium]
MKLAIVVQRYGKELIGGAESLARIIAHKLAENPNWQIDVYTSTAKDYQTWKNYFSKGISFDGKVRILRFQTCFPRFHYLFAFYKRLVSFPLKMISTSKKCPYFIKKIGYLLESFWFILQGPYCPSLIKQLINNKHEYHKVFFFTYLYYPSVFGIPPLGKKAVFVPTAHDETPLYFSRVKENFLQASYLLVNSEKERELVKSLSPQLGSKMSVAGIGLDQTLSKISPRPHLTNDKPYILFMGRMGKGKEVDVLIEYYLSWYQKHQKEELMLFLAGPLENNLSIPKHHGIRYLGVVSEEKKLDLLTNAFAIVNPSPHESLSMLVLEGIIARKPVILNGKDPVLNSYAELMSSVFSYHGKDEFINHLEYLNSRNWHKIRIESLNQSERWVNKNYSWKKIMDVYHHTVNMLPQENTLLQPHSN